MSVHIGPKPQWRSMHPYLQANGDPSAQPAPTGSHSFRREARLRRYRWSNEAAAAAGESGTLLSEWLGHSISLRTR